MLCTQLQGNMLSITQHYEDELHSCCEAPEPQIDSECENSQKLFLHTFSLHTRVWSLSEGAAGLGGLQSDHAQLPACFCRAFRACPVHSTARLLFSPESLPNSGALTHQYTC